MPYTNQQVEKIELFCNLRSLKKKYLISLEKLNINKNKINKKLELLECEIKIIEKELEEDFSK
jgi:hypothetical protein